MQKQEEISNPDSCLNKAADDEPLFVLRAHDRMAPMTVRQWAMRAKAFGSPKEKIDEAHRIANRMEAWAKEHGDKVPD